MRSPHSPDPRLVPDCVQVDTTTGRFVALEQVLGERVSVTELGTRRSFALALSLTEWLSDRFRLPTTRDRGAFAAATVALSHN